jgi:hypothetical protein
MPYIPPEARKRVEVMAPERAGELTYNLYSECMNYLNQKGFQFARFADVLGALEATKLELYRRHIGPYEDQKIEENGDV